MKINHTITLLILAITLVVLTVGFVAGLTIFLQKQEKQLQSEMQAIADEESLASERATIKSLVEKSTEDRSELASYIIDGDDGTAALLSEVDAMANKLGVELRTNSLATIEQKDSVFSKLSVKFTFTGSEKAVRHLVILLENLPYASEVTSLQISDTTDQVTGIPKTTGAIEMLISIMNI